MSRVKNKLFTKSFKLSSQEFERFRQLQKGVGMVIPFSEIIVEALNDLCEKRKIPKELPTSEKENPPWLFGNDERNQRSKPEPAEKAERPAEVLPTKARDTRKAPPDPKKPRKLAKPINNRKKKGKK